MTEVYRQKLKYFRHIVRAQNIATLILHGLINWRGDAWWWWWCGGRTWRSPRLRTKDIFRQQSHPPPPRAGPYSRHPGSSVVLHNSTA